MNKSELIKYLVKSSGISISESKLFFESVLRIISSSLLPGESILLPEGGYFHFRKAKLDTRSTLLKDKLFSDKTLDIIIYSTENDFKKSQRQNLVFNIPEPDTVVVDYLDSYFSFSIEKQLMPVTPSDYESLFIPRSTAELKRFIETKAKKFFDQCELIKPKHLTTEPLIIGSDAVYGDQNEPDWNEIKERAFDEGTKNTSASEIDFGSISWDFSSELEKEIKEDEILDFSRDEILNKTIEDEIENLTWDFGLSNSFETSVEAINEIQNETQTEIETKNETKSELEIIKQKQDIEELNQISEKSKNEDLSFDDIETQIESLSAIVLNEEQLDDTDKFQRVVAAVESEISNKNYFETNDQDRNRPQIKSDSTSDSAPAAPSDFPDVKEIINQVAKKNNEQNQDNLKSEFLNKKNSIFREKDFDKKRRSPFWIVFAVSIFITFLFVYFFIINKAGSTASSDLSQNVIAAEINKPALVLERDFLIPITYPYPNTYRLRIQQYDPLSELQKQNKSIETESKDSTALIQRQIEKLTGVELREGSNYKNAGRNIFKYSDAYAVQVASYKALNMAEDEAKKYILRGNNAFIQKVDIKGMGIWYRVKVGGFKTLEEAQRFSNTIR